MGDIEKPLNYGDAVVQGNPFGDQPLGVAVEDENS
jgi:hypothetical protein